MYFNSQIRQNARVITQLHSRIHETFARRDENDHCRLLWEEACSEFHEHYRKLAFPGGTFDEEVSLPALCVRSGGVSVRFSLRAIGSRRET